MKVVWYLDEALSFIETLSGKLNPRYHLALAGSVLLKGSSIKDLDLIVYPASTEDQDQKFVEDALAGLGLVKLHNRDVVQARWRRLGSKDMKHVEVWEYEGKRVDIFYLS